MPKTIYVVGGTNGVGKSTIREELLGSTIPYINADFIAKELKSQHASLMLAELARQYGSDQIKKYIAAGESFAFENNLHELKTFQWLEEMQKKGYEKLLLIDNTTISQICLQAEKGNTHYHNPGTKWVDDFINSMQTKSQLSAKGLNTIEEVKKLYQSKKASE